MYVWRKKVWDALRFIGKDDEGDYIQEEQFQRQRARNRIVFILVGDAIDKWYWCVDVSMSARWFSSSYLSRKRSDPEDRAWIHLLISSPLPRRPNMDLLPRMLHVFASTKLPIKEFEASFAP